MNIIKDKINLPIWLIFLLFMLFIIGVLSFWYYFIPADSMKMSGLLGGIVSGLIVFALTFITSIQPLQELDKFKEMGIRGVLANRHDKTYYKKLVSKAERNVRVMGASCTRFVEDFLDINSEDKVLVDALRNYRDLKIELLIPQDNFMAEEARLRASILPNKLAQLAEEFQGRVQLRRFSGKAQHSFVIVDDDLIAGPIFGDDKSKYAPAVHIAISTAFGVKYNQHFTEIWNGSESP